MKIKITIAETGQSFERQLEDLKNIKVTNKDGITETGLESLMKDVIKGIAIVEEAK